MISVKYALIIAVGAFVAGSFFASPVPQAIAAVIATDVQCTGCVGASDLASSAVTTTKLASNSVNGGKISDGTISAADLGPDSVGASELKGVSKFLFAQCTYTDSATSVGSVADAVVPCSLVGTDSDDSAIATLNSGDLCFDVSLATAQTDSVTVYVRNECPFSRTIGTLAIGLMVYDK